MEKVVLGIDLASSTLPDAIAAMVEAWYEAQDVEAALDPALCECIDYILSRDVEWTSESSIKVSKLIEIRSQQAKGSRSNAKRSLLGAGIWYNGKGDDRIRIFSGAEVLSGLDAEKEELLGLALLRAPGGRLVNPVTGGKSFVDLPVSYFLGRLVV